MAGRDFALLKRAMRNEYDPRNFGAAGDGVTNDTAGVLAAIQAAIATSGAVYLGDRSYVVDTLPFDGSFFEIRGPGKLIASSNIPASGAILLSLSGANSDDDDDINQPLLDGIYGSGVYSVRTSVVGSLEGVHIDNVTFVANSAAIRGIWATRFTRGCRIMGCYFDGFDGDAVCINGSWSFALIDNYCEGDGTNGTGFSLGRTGNGEGAGAVAVNAPCIIGNEITGHSSGMIWNFGSGGAVVGNRFEFNAVDGFASQSVVGLTVTGNYFEQNDGDNLDMGGTNGTDFADGWFVVGNYFNNTSGGGHNIRLDGVKNCRLGPNYFGGTRTQHYFIPSGGGGANVLQNHIWVPAISSTYISNNTELSETTNIVTIIDSASMTVGSPFVTARSGLLVGDGSLAPSAIAEFDSTTKGVLLPRLTTTERDAISSPADGLLIYNLTTDKLTIRANGTWVEVH